MLTQLPGQPAWSIALPNDPAIIGFALFAQAFPLLPAANPAGVLATNGIEAVVGN